MRAALDTPDHYYIVAESDGQEADTRVLKHGETFGVFDAFGDISARAAQQGLFHAGTRHLSHCRLRLAGHRPFLLNSAPGGSSHVLTIDLTNPDVHDEGQLAWPRGQLHVRRTSFLWNATWFTRISCTNHGQTQMAFPIEMAFDADFLDLFEVRGTHRLRRGQRLPVRIAADGVVFGYAGLDHVERRTTVQIDPAPATVDGDRRCQVDMVVAPGQQQDLLMAVTCGSRPLEAPLLDRFTEGRALSTQAIDRVRRRLTTIRTSSDLFNEWLERSRADLAMMVTETPNGPYPYAGIPWFSTMFGRDGILTALSVLWADPSLARGVLLALAATQATATDPVRDAQPGKILHEARDGEMAALGEIPFRAYYGSVDSTPLFLLLAGRYFDRTNDLATIERLWPHLEAALTWIDRYGDVDGDGFIEYARATERGLVHQGWKDSHDAIFHADGTLAEGPIALSEVQGYVYAARHHAADMAGALGHAEQAARLREQAEHLRDAFLSAFWCEELETYALALDGNKRPCRVVSSNAAQCLLSGIATQAHAERVAGTAMGTGMFSGWGLRTVRDGEVRYNPMAYHNGSIWPHDTALAALGFARYGLKDPVVRISEGLFDAAQQFQLCRLPELFCGFTRRHGEQPTRYPTACAPQAWASASAFLLLQALLGIEIDSGRHQITLHHPRLPAGLEWLRLNTLTVGDAEMDLLCERRGDDVGISVTRRAGAVRLVTER
jgi:glycogen debranching enzyme